ncbi:hypothetical protein D3C74_167240 [compost metagenome]
MMNQRFRITRSMQEGHPEPVISLDECKAYFAQHPDFDYSQVLTVVGAESTMTIEGDFFMWKHADLDIPFRHYEGDVYVAVVHEAVVPKMMEIATDLHADLVEG